VACPDVDTGAKADDVCFRIRILKQQHGTWEAVSAALEYKIPRGSLASYAKGRPVKKRSHRKVLGLCRKRIMVELPVEATLDQQAIIRSMSKQERLEKLLRD
jgi:hypothetical protein